jgi:hypothetical protein
MRSIKAKLYEESGEGEMKQVYRAKQPVKAEDQKD